MNPRSLLTRRQLNVLIPLLDVGGGAVKNKVRNNLARISLRWMIRQCFVLRTGILFQRDSLPWVGLDPDTLWPVVKPRPEPVYEFSKGPPALERDGPSMGQDGLLTKAHDFVNEEEEDLADLLSPVNDMLKIAKSWWLLEVIPQKIRFQKDDDSWVRKLS